MRPNVMRSRWVRSRYCIQSATRENGALRADKAELSEKAADYDTLAHSFALFARKFNSSDPDFIRKIVALSAE